MCDRQVDAYIHIFKSIRGTLKLRIFKFWYFQSAYIPHILNLQHEYGSILDTVYLIKPINKDTLKNWWQAFIPAPEYFNY